MTEEQFAFAKKAGKWAFIIIVLLVLFGASFGTIGAGERGVKTRLGAIVGTVEQGPYFKLPFIESVHIMDVRAKTVRYENTSEGNSQLAGASSDLQDVWMGVVVNYHIDPTKVADIYAQYRDVDNYSANVIEPIIKRSVKTVSAQYTADELVKKRPEVSDKINGILAEELNVKGSVLETFSITNFQYSKAYSDAIEAKVTAEQKALTAKNDLERVKFEAEQRKVRATRIKRRGYVVSGSERSVLRGII